MTETLGLCTIVGKKFRMAIQALRLNGALSEVACL